MSDDTKEEVTLPTYFKDATGFCYTATARLATDNKLTPWDGDVDEGGFAVTEKPAPKKGK